MRGKNINYLNAKNVASKRGSGSKRGKEREMERERWRKKDRWTGQLLSQILLLISTSKINTAKVQREILLKLSSSCSGFFLPFALFPVVVIAVVVISVIVVVAVHTNLFIFNF